MPPLLHVTHPVTAIAEAWIVHASRLHSSNCAIHKQYEPRVICLTVKSVLFPWRLLGSISSVDYSFVSLDEDRLDLQGKSCQIRKGE